MLAKTNPFLDKLAYFGGKPAVSLSPAPWPAVTPELRAYVDDALASGRIGYGPDCLTRDLEEAWADRHSVRYAVAVNSGTTALMAAYHGCGLGCWPGEERIRLGDEVIVGAFGFFATASALLPLGLKPVFCDVESDTGCLAPAAVTAAIGRCTVGLAVTHVAGHLADMPALTRLADGHGLALVEDGSHAHGSHRGGRLAGTFGTAAAFSFQTGKLVSGGEGGIVMTDDQEVFRRICQLVNFRRLHGTGLPIDPRLAETGLGMKLRMGPLESAMAHYHLKNLDRLVAERLLRLDRLTALLRDFDLRHFAPPETRPEHSRGAHYEYLLTVRPPHDADPALVRQVALHLLAAEGVRPRTGNTKAIHRLPIFGSPNLRGDFPNADALEAGTIPLPTFTTEPLVITDQYAEAIRKVDRVLPDVLGAFAMERLR